MKAYEVLTETVAFVLCMILSALVVVGIASVIVGAVLIVVYAMLGR